MWKYLFIFVILFSFSPALVAQGGPPSDTTRFERVKAAKEAFLREELPLTPAEAERFFPVYWKYENLTRRFRRGGRPGLGHENSLGLTEAQALEKLKENREHRQQMLSIKTEAETAYLEIISATKVVRLPEIERDFREKLLKRLKQSRGRGRN